MNLRLLLLTSLLPAPAHAGPRTSANYSILTDTADAGGRRGTSANYTNDGSLGGVAGISNVASPAEVAKSGYLGQLYDVTGLTLNAASLTVNEGATDQLAAWQLLDDATILAVPAASVAWSVQSGPLTGISASGLATAGIVYQDNVAIAQGSYLGNTGTLALTVKNVNPDDFGSYAGDGLDDAWQNQYFGLNNPNAAPGVDFDGTGQTNVFKYIAGLNPLDGSRFTLSIDFVPDPLHPGQFLAGQKKLTFSPRFADRTYTITARPSLTLGGWNAITASAPSDNGATRSVTDLNASDPAKFYHVEIMKP